MNQRRDTLSNESVGALLQVIAPGSTLCAIHPIARDEFYNSSYIIEANAADGSHIRIAAKCYVECGADLAKKARLEFKALEWLHNHSIPVPEPLYLDEPGTYFGTPSIVTNYVPGEQIMSPSNPASDPLDWARQLATMLAQIHSIPCDDAMRSFLLEANSEVTWFLRSGSVPGYMAAHPDGPAVWQAVHDLLPNIQQVEPVLVHLDYWPGNVLWDQDRIAAVIDWEEAAYGDPAIDVAYCRMELFLNGMGPVADEFLSTYEVAMGTVANLAFWELAATARPMTDPEWESAVRAELRQFIADARRRASR